MTNDVERRFFEHNVSESKGFTLRFRPWILIRKEQIADKPKAIKREKFLKTGKGREEIKQFVREFLYPSFASATVGKGAVSAWVEKD